MRSLRSNHVADQTLITDFNRNKQTVTQKIRTVRETELWLFPHNGRSGNAELRCSVRPHRTEAAGLAQEALVRAFARQPG